MIDEVEIDIKADKYFYMLCREKGIVRLFLIENYPNNMYRVVFRCGNKNGKIVSKDYFREKLSTTK